MKKTHLEKMDLINFCWKIFVFLKLLLMLATQSFIKQFQFFLELAELAQNHKGY